MKWIKCKRTWVNFDLISSIYIKITDENDCFEIIAESDEDTFKICCEEFESKKEAEEFLDEFMVKNFDD